MRLLLNIFIVFLLVCKPAAPWLDYALNRDRIMQTLCINKAKPQLHCNGKCYLGKALADEDNEHSKPISKSKKQIVKLLDFFILVETEKQAPDFYKIEIKSSTLFDSTYRYCFIDMVFRPPIFC